MTDTVTPEVRSRMMAAIKGRNTKPEIALRKALHKRGLRYQLNVRALPGSPDIVLPRWGTAIFVHGCFWHRHANCAHATTPKTRNDFWNEKFRANLERDKRNETLLLDGGWRLVIAWECRISRRPDDFLVDQIVEFIKSRNGSRLECEAIDPDAAPSG